MCNCFVNVKKFIISVQNSIKVWKEGTFATELHPPFFKLNILIAK